MAENNTPNTQSATSAKRRIVISIAACLVLIVIFVVLFFWSVNLYRKAAENGVPEAQFTLGMHYRYGLGIKKDKVEAWDLWRKAAEKGLKPAQNKLAKIHKDIEKAAGADKADSRVQLLWGACLANGWGPKKDEASAIEWFRKAADNGNADAKAFLEQKEKEEAEKQQKLKAAEELKKQAESPSETVPNEPAGTSAGENKTETGLEEVKIEGEALSEEPKPEFETTGTEKQDSGAE